MTRPQSDLAGALAALDQGGVVLMPTDTVLGLAARPDRQGATDKIFALKARPAHKSLPVMVHDSAAISRIGGVLTAVARSLAASPFCPGALTLVVPIGSAPDPWLRGRAELAFRIPDDPFMLQLLAQAGPLCVTSANLSGQLPPATTHQAAQQLTGAPDYVVPGIARGDAPSTLVNCAMDPPKIERLGALSALDLAPYVPNGVFQ